MNVVEKMMTMMMEDSLEAHEMDGTGSDEKTGNGIRRISSRAEVDTSMPFESVKEAVTRFGGSGPWLPLYRLRQAYQNSVEDFDIKRIEEQAAKLEKDLIMKELETLDVLEELGSAKTILEKLKQQLQSEALKCSANRDVSSCESIEALVKKSTSIVNHQEQILQSPRPLPTSPPDMLLTELKQAKTNLGKTINDLGVIQSSVETLNKKMKKERLFLERTRENLQSKFAAISAQNAAEKEARSKPRVDPVEADFTFHTPQNVVRDLKIDVEQNNGMVETRPFEVSKQGLENGEDFAEMRWFAAKKMEEAAMAAEAVALAEFKALSSANSISSQFSTREHHKFQIPEESILKKVIQSSFQIDAATASKLTVLKKLEEATAEVLHSREILTEAINGIETASRKQQAAEEALRRWIHENGPKGEAMRSSIKRNKFNRVENCQALKPALRSSVSMRDLLNRKQVPDEYPTTKEMEKHAETKVALSQMLQTLRENQTLQTEHENGEDDQKQSVVQRKKFGFMRLSFPLGKRNNKKT